MENRCRFWPISESLCMKPQILLFKSKKNIVFKLPQETFWFSKFACAFIKNDEMEIFLLPSESLFFSRTCITISNHSSFLLHEEISEGCITNFPIFYRNLQIRWSSWLNIASRCEWKHARERPCKRKFDLWTFLLRT